MVIDPEPRRRRGFARLGQTPTTMLMLIYLQASIEFVNIDKTTLKKPRVNEEVIIWPSSIKKESIPALQFTTQNEFSLD